MAQIHIAWSFKKNIRQYNMAFAFTSVRVNIDRSVLNGSGTYAFRISCELRHLSGGLLPPPGHAPRYAQLYIHDPQDQSAHREGRNHNLNPVVMTLIQGILNQSHPYAELYKQAFQIMREKPPEEHDTVVFRLHADRNRDL